MPKFTRRHSLKLIAGTILAAPFVRTARAAGSLNVYNWADYIGETTIEDFQSATGISVNYDNFASTEEMTAKMLAGSTGYDLVLQSGKDLPRMIEADLYERLDLTKLPNFSNLDPAVTEICKAWDAGNQHSIPYMWGSVGFVFNIDMVKERIPDADIENLDILLKPENAAKLADCGITLLDTPWDVFAIVLKYMGKDPNVATEADYRAAAERIKPIRRYIKTFDNTNFLNALPNGEVCVANLWSGDYATAETRAHEAGVDINLKYVVPKSGAPAWVDVWCMPKDAPNRENAYKFANYLLEPEVIAKCSNTTRFANANLKAPPFMDKSILENPALYPDQQTKERLFTPQPTSEEQDRAYTRVWADVKSG